MTTGARDSDLPVHIGIFLPMQEWSLYLLILSKGYATGVGIGKASRAVCSNSNTLGVLSFHGMNRSTRLGSRDWERRSSVCSLDRPRLQAQPPYY